MKLIFLLLLLVTQVCASEYKTVYNLIKERKNQMSEEVYKGLSGNIKFSNATDNTPWPKGECWEENKLKGEAYLKSLKEDKSFLIMARNRITMSNVVNRGIRIEGTVNGKKYRSLSSGMEEEPYNKFYCMVEVLDKDCDFCRRLMMAKCLLEYLYAYI